MRTSPRCHESPMHASSVFGATWSATWLARRFPRSPGRFESWNGPLERGFGSNAPPPVVIGVLRGSSLDCSTDARRSSPTHEACPQPAPRRHELAMLDHRVQGVMLRSHAARWVSFSDNGPGTRAAGAPVYLPLVRLCPVWRQIVQRSGPDCICQVHRRLALSRQQPSARSRPLPKTEPVILAVHHPNRDVRLTVS